MRVEISGEFRKRETDRLKDRGNVGKVTFLMDKLSMLRDAGVCCVHIEAVMEDDRGLTDLAKRRPT